MNASILRALFSVLCLLSSVVLARSADAPARTEIRFMSWELDQEGLFITENGRDYAPITAPAYAFGAPIFIRADSPLRIYRQTIGPDGPVYTIVGEASLPPGSRLAQAYLIRQSDQLTPRDYRVIAMSNDPAAFAIGRVRVFNFSPLEAAVKIGAESVRLRPLEWKTLTAEPDRKHRVSILAALQLTENDWTPGVRDMVTLRENYRGNVTLLHTRIRFDQDGPVLRTPDPRMLIRTSTDYVNPQEPKLTSLRGP
ncbi:hypothetical protein [Rariglobus hedericola]|uniref:Uncharacterized protein n=1 Tax=Rariglobus hedericola TaxID=2597822 RepID=A0A556QSI1_9BACT|nr:hypothetical protein [Rariglobus hedericola]TSJ79583.1 hypothetical protein FPL22_09945 [Rariglobus hedericola]